MHCGGDKGDANCLNSDDDRSTSSATPEDDDDDTLASCFDFRLLSRVFDINPINSSTFTRHALPSLLTRTLCSDSDSSARYSTNKRSTSSSYREVVSSPPLFVSVLPSPSVQRPCIISGNGDCPAHDCWQVPADDVTGHVTAHRRTLMTSRYSQKQRSQQQQQHTMLIAGFMQPDESSSSWSSSGLYRKRTSFHHEVQVIKIDQTQRVCRAGAALSRHTEELHQSDLVD